MILMIDNFDSFTYNLVHYLTEIGEEVVVKRNDEVSIPTIKNLNPNHIVISPGPCTPDQAGVTLEVIEKLAGKIPILGVCLGHQAIAQVFGGKVMEAEQVIHGKTSIIHHHQQDLFKNFPQCFSAMRYHSLVVDWQTLPDCLQVTAWTEKDGQPEYIMGLKHQELALTGVQFHPESILSEYGHQILKNFISEKQSNT